MTELEISPLAKRLAEENNVDWRQLTGSGENGKVVERDVLDYLARVMAGDEAIDPTPEPLPDGLGSWEDQGEGSAESWQATPDTDRIAGAAGGEDTGADATDTLWSDDDSGLLEVDSEDEPVLEQDPAIGESDWNRAAGESFDLGFSPGGEQAEPEIDEDIFLFGDESSIPSETAATDVAGGQGDSGQEWSHDLGGFGERFDHAGSDSHSDTDNEGDEPGRYLQTPWQELDANELQEPDSSTGWQADLAQEEYPAGGQEPAWSVPDPSESTVDRDGSEEREYSPAKEPASWQYEVDSPASETDVDLQDVSDEFDALDSQALDGVELQEEETRVAGIASLAAAEAATAEVQAGQEQSPELTVSTPPATGAPAPSAEPRAPQTVPERLRTGNRGRGMVLRREVELTALVQAQEAVAQELGLERVAPASFLIRAAVRAGRPWPLGEEGVVALAILDDAGVASTMIEDAGTLPFRELLARCSQAFANEDSELPGSSLVVADLSQLGIDEAVLDLDVPVLSLGRVVGKDGYRATLSLSGPVLPDAGSRFLARVVELLAAPVRLVL